MQGLNIQAHRAQLAAKPAAYLGHMPGSGIQAHSAGEHFAAWGIIMEIRLDKAGRIIWTPSKDGRILCQSRNYNQALAVAISRVQH